MWQIGCEAIWVAPASTTEMSVAFAFGCIWVLGSLHRLSQAGCFKVIVRSYRSRQPQWELQLLFGLWAPNPASIHLGPAEVCVQLGPEGKGLAEGWHEQKGASARPAQAESALQHPSPQQGCGDTGATGCWSTGHRAVGSFSERSVLLAVSLEDEMLLLLLAIGPDLKTRKVRVNLEPDPNVFES